MDAVPDPGGDFAVIQFGAVERRVDVGSQVRPEHGEGLAVEMAAAEGLDEIVHLELRVEPARFQVRPGAAGQRVAAREVRIVFRKADRRPVQQLVLEPGGDPLHGRLEIGLALQFHKHLSCFRYDAVLAFAMEGYFISTEARAIVFHGTVVFSLD